MKHVSKVAALLCLFAGINPPVFAQTTGTVVGPDNLIHLSFPTAYLPGVTPTSWGFECALFSIGPTSGGALWFQEDAVASTRGFNTVLDFMLVSTAMEDGSAISIAVMKAVGDREGAKLNWRLYVQRVAQSYRFAFVAGEDSDEVVWFSEPIAGGRAYRHRIEYDILHQHIAWSVDGITINSTTMLPGHSKNVGFHIFGSSGSSTGRNTMFLLDRIRWTEIR
jgi:hypothetical protein